VLVRLFSCFVPGVISAESDMTFGRLVRPWDVCVRRCLLPYEGFLIYRGTAGGHRDRARGRRLRHGIQRRAARRCRYGSHPDWPALPGHPRRSRDRGTSSEPRLDAKLTCISHPSIHPFTQEESSLDVQKRIAREFYDTVEDIPLDDN